ncbi:MAG: leucine-rich repeat protein [Oscillospiraceae bacterium]|nr:leucine-rich repeat protein [Oscillospiraceae bacterium]
MTHNDKTIELYEIVITHDDTAAPREAYTGNRTVFQLLKNTGTGSSCAVYRAKRADGTGGSVLLKCCLSVEQDAQTRFLQTVLRQYTLLEDVNGIAPLIGTYRGNDGHLWTLHSYEHGAPYNEMQEKDLHQLLRNTRYIAQTIRRSHQQGFLHLDITPGNVFLYTAGSGKEGAAIVDCDSFIHCNDILDPQVPLYTSDAYGAYEVRMNKRHKIGPAADVYSFGVIVFEKLFGRLPDRLLEGNGAACYRFEQSPMYDQMSAKVKALLTGFFDRTICTGLNGRFQSMDEVITQLETLIGLTSPQNRRRPRLCKRSIRPTQSAEYLLVRQALLTELEQVLFRDDRVAVLVGANGTGKSELARYFAQLHEDRFDSIELIVMQATTPPRTADDIISQMRFLDCNAAPMRADVIRQLDEHALLIIDHFDLDDTTVLRALSDLISNSGGSKIIITTCYEHVAQLSGVKRIAVGGAEEESLELFHKICNRSYDEAEMNHLKKLLKRFGSNLFATDLIARTLMEYPQTTPQSLWESCLEKRVLTEQSSTDGYILFSTKDEAYRADSYSDHIKALYTNVLQHPFSSIERRLMALLSASPGAFFDADIICQILGDDRAHQEVRAALNRFTARNWVQKDMRNGKQTIAISSLLYEALRDSGMTMMFPSDEMLLLRNLCTIVDLPNFDDYRRLIRAKVRPFELNVPPVHMLTFISRLDLVLRLRIFRHMDVGSIKGPLLFGMSYVDSDVEYWVYLTEENVTVRYFHLRRGYDITPDDLMPVHMELTEKQGRAEERSYLHFVLQKNICAYHLDLRTSTLYTCKAAYLDLWELFSDARLRPYTILEGPFNGGFSPQNMDTIGPMAFRRARTWLKAVAIPGSVTTIEPLAFAGCTGLEQICFCAPHNLKTIRTYAFAFCGLKELLLPEGIETIEDRAFSNCAWLRCVRLPNSLKRIAPFLFSGNFSLSQIHIPADIEQIDETAFFSCRQLHHISYPPNTVRTSTRPSGDIQTDLEKWGDLPVWSANGSYRMWSEYRFRKPTPGL